MAPTQKSQARKRGAHCNRGEVRSSIIQFILENNGSIKEPDIRKHLKERYSISDQGGINKHLHELGKDRIVELVEPKKSSRKLQRHGLTNRWDITKIEHLKNIKDKYKDITLNKYEKSLHIILKECNYSITMPIGLKLYIQLLLSTSLFNTYIETNLESLNSSAWEIYQYDKGLKNEQSINKSLNKCYNTYINSNPNSKTARETFQVEIKKIFFNVCEEKFPGWFKEMPEKTYLKIIGEFFIKNSGVSNEISDDVLKICEERFPEWFKLMPREKYLQFARILDKTNNELLGKAFIVETVWKNCEVRFPDLFKEISDKIYLKIIGETIANRGGIVEELFVDVFKEKLSDEKLLELKTFIRAFYDDLNAYNALEATISLLRIRLLEFVMLRQDLIFDNCLYNDIITGFVSPDELEFAKKTKENFERYISRPESEYNNSSFEKMLLFDIKQASKIIVKYKQPSVFSSTYNNYEDTCESLRKFFSWHFQPTYENIVELKKSFPIY